MYAMYKILIFLFISSQIFAQTFKQKIVDEWVKDNISLYDGSPILKEDVRKMQLRYTFMENDSFQITINGKTGRSTYQVKNDTLYFAKNAAFKIERLDDIKLVFRAVILDSVGQSKALRLSFIPARFHNIGFTPQTYRTKGQDTIYVSKHNYLEPLFIDADRSASQFISDNFFFPEYKAGDFFARFIITKQGEVKGIEILESTHENYNKYLIKAIKATAGKWKPAIWEGKPINSEVKMGFDMGWTEKMKNKNGDTSAQKDIIDSNESNYLLMQGNIFVEEKKYTLAIKELTKSIALDPLNIDAYYARAAVYALTKDVQKMCLDLQQLKNMQQTKGTELWNKFCQDKKKTPSQN
jgi:tetratricopeptide (TPR) repeat protein